MPETPAASLAARSPIEQALAELQRTVSATPAEIEQLKQAIERLQPAYAMGGYITGPGRVLSEGVLPVHPDECFIAACHVRAGEPLCTRPGHPTATSDCAGQPKEIAAP